MRNHEGFKGRTQKRVCSGQLGLQDSLRHPTGRNKNKIAPTHTHAHIHTHKIHVHTANIYSYTTHTHTPPTWVQTSHPLIYIDAPHIHIYSYKLIHIHTTHICAVTHIQTLIHT